MKLTSWTTVRAGGSELHCFTGLGSRDRRECGCHGGGCPVAACCIVGEGRRKLRGREYSARHPLFKRPQRLGHSKAGAKAENGHVPPLCLVIPMSACAPRGIFIRLGDVNVDLAAASGSA